MQGLTRGGKLLMLGTKQPLLISFVATLGMALPFGKGDFGGSSS
jgi:hypothetical protein